MPTSERDAREVVVTAGVETRLEIYERALDNPDPWRAKDVLGDCISDLREHVRALEPAPSGKWTREPPTEAGWYWVQYGSRVWNEEFEVGEHLGVPHDMLRWSLPIPLPPAPTDEVK